MIGGYGQQPQIGHPPAVMVNVMQPVGGYAPQPFGGIPKAGMPFCRSAQGAPVAAAAFRGQPPPSHSVLEQVHQQPQPSFVVPSKTPLLDGLQPNKEQENEESLPDEWLIDDREIVGSHHETGITYRMSKSKDPRERMNKIARWGTTVLGHDEGDGWLRVKDGGYLAMDSGGRLPKKLMFKESLKEPQVSATQAPVGAQQMAAQGNASVARVQAMPAMGNVIAPKGNSLAPKKDGVLLCVGDSLTAGKTHSTDTYPANLEKILKEEGFNSFAVKNTGVFAETSDKLMQRFPVVLGTAARSGPLSFVLVLSGTNDIFQYRTPEYILENLKRIHHQAANAPGSPSVAALTIPKCRLFSPQQDEMRLAINAGLKEMVEKMPAHRQRFLIDLEEVDVALAEDGVHYLGPGYVEFAERAIQAMHALWEQ